MDKKIHNRYMLSIYSRDNKLVRITIPSDDDKVYRYLVDILANSAIKNFTVFAHGYAKEYKWRNYWNIYDPIKEFKRQNIDFEGEKSRYIICDYNDKFDISKTYPRVLILPRFITKDEIIDCSNFRTKNRLPSILS
jgi:hypothetical protein